MAVGGVGQFVVNCDSICSDVVNRVFLMFHAASGIAADEHVLGTIEASFKQFHTFMDLLRDNELVLHNTVVAFVSVLHSVVVCSLGHLCALVGHSN